MSDPSPSFGAVPGHLEPSKLGTKQYWDALYSTELTNHASDPSDKGTVWFDDSDAEAKLLAFLSSTSIPPSSSSSSSSSAPTKDYTPLDTGKTTFLDLGSGNGSLLFALRREGWRGRALGVDYSENSVELARRIEESRPRDAEDEDESEGEGDGEDEKDGGGEQKTPVEFERWDVLRGDYDTVLNGGQEAGWDVVLDKGTFDAICLSEERDGEGRRICEGYKGRVARLVKRGTGLFVLTSCNWTEEELRAWFVGVEGEGEGEFVEHGRVEYRAFSFGGVKGQTISTLCFRRR